MADEVTHVSVGDELSQTEWESENTHSVDATKMRTALNVEDGADVTGDNAPQAHKDSHDPEDGSDALDTAAPSTIGTANTKGSAHSLARSDHVHRTGVKLLDADGDTKVDVEESADEDKIHMDVGGTEVFLLQDAGILTLIKQSAIRAYQSASAQDIPKETFTKVNLDAESYDIQSEFDSITNYRFTATEAGIYAVVGSIRYSEDLADGTLHAVAVYKNDAAIARTYSKAGAAAKVSDIVADIIQLSANDYLELWTYHAHSEARTLQNSTIYTYLAVAKIA